MEDVVSNTHGEATESVAHYLRTSYEQHEKHGHDMIAIGASAGGVEALITLVRLLPRKLAAAMFVVLHIPADSPSMLPELLNRVGHLHALHPVDGQEIEYGSIYVAPPDYHLLVEEGHVRVVQGPKENRHRPAVDPLFRSLALAYGPRAVGVVLTGSLDDGTAGLLAIKRRGGVAVVQDPADALYPSMPQSALTHVAVDYQVTLTELAPLLQRLSMEPSHQQEPTTIPEDMETEVKMAEADMHIQREDKQVGTPSAYSCPECGGVLWEIQDDELTRFRCRVGHAFTVDSMMAQQAEALEEALWVALKIVQERAAISHHMEEQARENGHPTLARRYQERWKDAEQRASLLMKALKREDIFSPALSEESYGERKQA